MWYLQQTWTSWSSMTTRRRKVTGWWRATGTATRWTALNSSSAISSEETSNWVRHTRRSLCCQPNFIRCTDHRSAKSPCSDFTYHSLIIFDHNTLWWPEQVYIFYTINILNNCNSRTYKYTELWSEKAKGFHPLWRVVNLSFLNSLICSSRQESGTLIIIPIHTIQHNCLSLNIRERYTSKTTPNFSRHNE